jgi:hypothetical protein
LKNDLDAKVFTYMATLEKTGDEIVKTLKHGITLLTQFKSKAPDPENRQQMLEQFRDDLKAGERITTKSTLENARRRCNFLYRKRWSVLAVLYRLYNHC